MAVFREVRRVLRSDGTLWLNLGDSYASKAGKGGNRAQTLWSANTYPAFAPHRSRMLEGIKPKDLIGIPWLVAFALRADGWYLRSDTIWSKPNPMPESVKDRPTKAHEYLFLLSKSDRYYYNGDAIKEPCVDEAYKKGRTRRSADAFWMADPVRGRSRANLHKNLGGRTHRNARSVWTIAPSPFPGAHFAVMPEKLAELCILAGCPVAGVVLDPFGGAGTTGVVAHRLGRSALLVELNPEYAQLAEIRCAA